MMEEADFQTGIFEEMPFEQYQQAQGLNQSTLKQIFRPGNYYNPHGVLIGNAGHCLLLEPERFEQDYQRLAPGISLRKLKKLEVEEDSSTEEPRPTMLPTNIWDVLMNARNAVNTHPQASWMLENSLKEVSLFWEASENSLRCKARLDLFCPEKAFIADLKFSYRTITEANTQWHYAFQAAWYRQGIYQLTGEWLPFYLIFVERNTPYRVVVAELEKETLEVGNRLLQKSLVEYNAYMAPPEFDDHA
jgi:hypothetical protein